ncbi:MAG: GH3 auxin-responsive promoter family protein [Treponema sp.]|jgi:hypothetical protein|nr:GH3 auxin-responsive promoter family protein [Treponema sp.]
MKERRLKKWWLIRLALTIIGKKGLKELDKVSMDGRKAQTETLRSILEYAKDTVYGVEHHFGEILKASTPEEFFSLYQKYVPVNEYEDLRPYVERHKSGGSNILFPGKPKLYATTSGTTREPKWIPVTERYYQEVYKKMNALWLATLVLAKPRAFYGPFASIVGKAIEGAAPDGTVYGSISGIMQRDIPGFMQAIHTAPAAVFKIANYKARYYAIMRMAIERNTHGIITANPSTLVEMQKNANEFYDEYVNDIEKGTLSHIFDISDEIRAELEPQLKPNPKRAKELRELKAKYGDVLPKHYWPDMQVVNVWFCGNTRIYFDKIKNSFPKDCEFNEFGYFSSECRAGLVLKTGIQDTVCFGHKIYFEFIHESELEKETPVITQMFDVKPGQRYCMLVTTSSGLYRYNMNDLLEITGYHNQFPTLKFVQKINGTVSLTGEKLHERQFIEAVQAVEQVTRRKVAFFVGFADVNNSNYRFYYEFADQSITTAEAEEFTKLVDAELQQYNVEYKEKRASDRVKAPETYLLGSESFEQFKSKCIDQGFRDGQFKLNLLMQDEKRHDMFKELIKQAS